MMSTPWQIWQECCQNQWNTNLKQWQQAFSGTWQAPAEYWQAVSSIMDARSRSVQSFWQQQPAQWAGLWQCQSWPQAVQHLCQWQGQTVLNAVNLAATTQAQRVYLLRQWQGHLPQAHGWMQQASNMATPTTQTTAKQQSATQAETPAAPKPSTMPSTKANGVSSHGSSTPQQASSPQKPAQNASRKPEADDSQPSLLNETNATNGHTVSTTANSVMRSSNGASVASAAAAARRSVVARRSTSRRMSRATH